LEEALAYAEGKTHESCFGVYVAEDVEVETV